MRGIGKWLKFSAGFEHSVDPARTRDVCEVGPHAFRKSGEIRSAESGGFLVDGAFNGHSQLIGLELHEAVVRRGTTVDAQSAQRHAR